MKTANGSKSNKELEPVKLIIYGLLIFFTISCQVDKNQSTGKEIPSKIQDFENFFEGIIGENIKVYAQIQKKDSIVSGKYFYKKNEVPLRLEGVISNLGKFTINESLEEKVTGSFTGTLSNSDSIIGKWQNQEKTRSFDFVLRRIELNPFENVDSKDEALSRTDSLIIFTEVAVEDSKAYYELSDISVDYVLEFLTKPEVLVFMKDYDSYVAFLDSESKWVTWEISLGYGLLLPEQSEVSLEASDLTDDGVEELVIFWNGISGQMRGGFGGAGVQIWDLKESKLILNIMISSFEDYHGNKDENGEYTRENATHCDCSFPFSIVEDKIVIGEFECVSEGESHYASFGCPILEFPEGEYKYENGKWAKM